MDIEELGEFGLIEQIKESFKCRDHLLAIGIGDDTAALNVPGDKATLITTDLLLEGVHFDLELNSAYYLGKKSLSVNLSDIAAMGGTPRYFLLSLGIPRRYPVESLREFFRGLKELSLNYRVKLIGGDTSASTGKLMISVTVLGEAPRGQVVRRTGAEVGDQIFVTGTLGDSLLGLYILRNGINPTRSLRKLPRVVRKHLDPQPRIKEGKLIAGKGLATAMIDLSDGLLADLGHLTRDVGLGAKLWREKLPLSNYYRRNILSFEQDKWKLALTGGEDYELLFTVSRAKVKQLRHLSSRFDCRLTRIGEVVEGSEDITVVDKNDKPCKINYLTGYDHFRARFAS
ncbi:MAG: thiamine-phosphate kinase [Deltaproteobacteria bacterium]|nr:MAG: thiamine-phosphate kinase [Deltaproteobacteria bacterium]